jgi:hypothetical protein
MTYVAFSDLVNVTVIAMFKSPRLPTDSPVFRLSCPITRSGMSRHFVQGRVSLQDVARVVSSCRGMRRNVPQVEGRSYYRCDTLY